MTSKDRILMVEVTDTVDVISHLKKKGLNSKNDFTTFLDSTMARFWCDSRASRKKLITALSDLNKGKVLNQDDINRYHLNYSHNRFGDVFFLADPGVLISPNFYQGKSLDKGMHGFDIDHPHQQSAFVIAGSSIHEAIKITAPIDMRCFFPTLEKLLKLPSSTNIEPLL